MRTLAIGLLLLSACREATPPPPPPSRTLSEQDMNRFLYLSVLEGLLEDSANPALIAALLERQDQHFVTKCPLCWQVSRAFLSYRQMNSSDSRGGGFPKAIQEELESADLKTRRAGLQKLVDRYVAAGFARRSMTEGEKAQMRKLLDEGKKFGMDCAKATQFGDACPSCNGATRKP